MTMIEFKDIFGQTSIFHYLKNIAFKFTNISDIKNNLLTWFLLRAFNILEIK